MSVARIAAPLRLRRVAKIEVLIPKNSNDGIAFPRLRFLKFEEFLRSRTGGWTREADVVGSWSSPGGDDVRDCSRRYVVVVEPTVGVSLADAIAEHVRREFAQKAVFLTLTLVEAVPF